MSLWWSISGVGVEFQFPRPDNIFPISHFRSSGRRVGGFCAWHDSHFGVFQIKFTWIMLIPRTGEKRRRGAGAEEANTGNSQL